MRTTNRLRSAFPFLLAAGLAAQWPNSPATNLAVGDGNGDQALPKIAATADGGCYLAWFDNRGGNYAVYLQRLDAHGAEQWPHGGSLVSNHPQNTSLIDWDLIADSDGHCVLTFTDIRAGGDLDVYAYRMSPSGVFDWGPNGVALSNNGDFDANPHVCEATDGDFVFVWTNNTQRTVQLQRLDRLGNPRYPGDGIATLGDTGATPAFAHVVAGDNGSVVACWVRASAFSAAKHLHAQKFDVAGNALWNGGTRLPVFDLTSLPIAHDPKLVADGAGGAVMAWHYAPATQFFARVQHVLASGAEAFAHNGVDLSTNGNSHFDPTAVWLPATQEILAVFNERNVGQSAWGITAQEIDAAGSRVFGSSGQPILPVGATEQQNPVGAPSLDGIVAGWFTRLPAAAQYKITAARVDRAGNLRFAPTVDVATAGSEKLRLVVAGTATGTALFAWSDRRVDSGDVYAQDVNPDGSLGDRYATVTPYGCGGNPAGSLVTTGRLGIGLQMTVGVDNPLGTQAAGALAALGVAFAAAPGYPCGSLLPGYGMSAPGAPGEVLLGLAGPTATLLAGPWAGAGHPVAFLLAAPPNPAYYGVALYVQGVLLDLQPGAAIPVGLTTGVRLVVGS